jgi:hypothetical protein
MNIVDKEILGRLCSLILLENANKIDVQFLTLAVISFYIAGACFVSITFIVSTNLSNLYHDLSFIYDTGCKARLQLA